jgi:hypothetical protein
VVWTMKASARAAGLAADEAPARCGNGPTGDFSAERVHARDLRNQGGDRRRTCTANFLMSWMFQRRSPALMPGFHSLPAALGSGGAL